MSASHSSLLATNRACSNMRIKSAAFLLVAFMSLDSLATCYTVYDKDDRPLYRSFNAPFDISGSISEGIASTYPGGYLMQTDSNYCPPVEKEALSINDRIKERVANTKPGQVEPVRKIATSDNQVDSTNAERIRGETNNFVTQEAVKEAMKEARTSAESSGKCGFEYFTYGDDHGKRLADAAREECLNNEALKKVGKDGEMRLDAYNAWKDQHQITSNQRAASQNAAALGQINRKLNAIRSTQKFGY